MTASPRVSIGIPVYNGAATIGQALDSLLGQSFGDFELLVSDNASTDSTGEIVREYAEHDHRVHYHRHATNIGANLNYSHVARMARGEFLKWAAAGDWCAPTFLERCVRALEADPEAVLAAPRTRLFEGDTEHARNYDHDLAVLDATPAERLARVANELYLNNAINGLIRLAALRRTRLIEPYIDADVVLMGHLALLGRFLLVEEPLFYRRMEIETSTSLQDAASKERHHYPHRTARTLLQGWKRQIGWFRAGAAAPMRLGQRIRVLTWMARMSYWERAALLSDLKSALRYAAGKRG